MNHQAEEFAMFQKGNPLQALRSNGECTVERTQPRLLLVPVFSLRIDDENRISEWKERVMYFLRRGKRGYFHVLAALKASPADSISSNGCIETVFMSAKEVGLDISSEALTHSHTLPRSSSQEKRNRQVKPQDVWQKEGVKRGEDVRIKGSGVCRGTQSK